MKQWVICDAERVVVITGISFPTPLGAMIPVKKGKEYIEGYEEYL